MTTKSGRQLTPAEIVGYAAAAGFPKAELTTATAVALAEHRGDVRTGSLGDEHLTGRKWGPSVGVWQVRSLRGDYLRGATGADRYRDQAKLTDPAYNATAALAIWREAGGWTPWSTWPGISTLYLPSARSAVAGAKTPAVADVSSGAAAGSNVVPVTFTGDAQQAGFGDGLVGAGKALTMPLTLGLGLLNPANMFGAAKEALNLFANLMAFIAKAAVWVANPDNWIRIAQVWLGTWLVVLGLLMFGWPAIGKAANFIPAGKVAKAAGAAKGAGAAAKAAEAV